MTTGTETIYLGHNNTVVRYLRDGKRLIDLSDITRVELMDTGCQVFIDSDLSPDAFDWSEQDVSPGKLTLNLGQEDIPPGSYNFWLIVYDPSNPEGVVWDRFKIKFVALCAVGDP